MKCPRCGYMINGIGRKSYSIPFAKVYKALQYHLRGRRKGEIHYLNTAKKMEELFGIKVSAGFVWERIQKQKERDPKVLRKKERMKEVYRKTEEG